MNKYGILNIWLAKNANPYKKITTKELEKKSTETYFWNII